jgi:hypothetical protein
MSEFILGMKHDDGNAVRMERQCSESLNEVSHAIEEGIMTNVVPARTLLILIMRRIAHEPRGPAAPQRSSLLRGSTGRRVHRSTMKIVCMATYMISLLISSTPGQAQLKSAMIFDAKNISGSLRVLGRTYAGSKGEGVFERIDMNGNIFSLGMPERLFTDRYWTVADSCDGIDLGVLATDNQHHMLSIVTAQHEDITFHCIFRSHRLTKMYVEDLFRDSPLQRFLSLPPELQPLSLEGLAGVSAIRWSEIEKSGHIWEDVAKSNNIEILDAFIRANPKTGEDVEVQGRIAGFFRALVGAAKKAKFQVVSNVTYIRDIPIALNMSEMGVVGGRLVWANGSIVFYSDPTNNLVIDPSNGIKFLRGRGAIVTPGKMFTYGLNK